MKIWRFLTPSYWLGSSQTEADSKVVRPFATNSIRGALRQARELERRRTKRTDSVSESNGPKNPILYNQHDIQISRGVISLSSELREKVIKNLQSKLKLAQINISAPVMLNQLHTTSTLSTADKEEISFKVGSEIEVEVDRSLESSATLFISLKKEDASPEADLPPAKGQKLRYVK